MSGPITQDFNETISAYKVAFFDIDGTIFKSDYSISNETVATIRKLQQRGIKTCLATGRPYFGSKDVIKELGIKDASMFSSGGLIMNPENNEIIFTDKINDGQILSMLREMKDCGAHIELYTHDKYFIEEENDISRMHIKYLQLDPVIESFDGALNKHFINKAVAIAVNAQQLTALKAITQKYPAYSFAFSFGASHPDVIFLNITSRKASRKGIFEFFLRYFAVEASQTIAFGDSDADVAFLECAGLGIAVGNATEKAKAAARYVTLGVEEDGVVYALKAMGL